MHERLLDLLRCPACQQALGLSVYGREAGGSASSISSGLLSCACGLKYPIWKGVPRMLTPGDRTIPDEYLEEFKRRLRADAPEFFEEHARQKPERQYTFDTQWSMYQYGELTWEVRLADRVKYFYQFTGTQPASLNGGLVLDAGCGNGTLSAGIAASGPAVVGMDYSETGVVRAESQKARFAGSAAHRVHYVQANVMRPPFAPETFDVVYSDGVLHHTPSTRISFCALASLVKPGGRYFVMLYRDRAAFPYNWKFKIVKTLQRVLRPLPLGVTRRLCYVGAAILLTRIRLLHLFGNRKRLIVPLHLRAVNLFDTLTPRYYHLHTPQEIEGWFRSVGFTNAIETGVAPLKYTGVAMVAVRQPLAQPFAARLAHAG